MEHLDSQELTHREELHALRETLQAEAAAAAAVLTAERLRKLDEALSDRSTKLLQDNVRLKAELKVHTDVSRLLSICIYKPKSIVLYCGSPLCSHVIGNPHTRSKSL